MSLTLAEPEGCFEPVGVGAHGLEGLLLRALRSSVCHFLP